MKLLPTGNMNYRCMQISDYEAVTRLWRACDGLLLRDSDSKSGIGKYLARNPGLSFVALDDAGMVGTIMAGHDGRRGYIQHLAVAESSRRRGVGSHLIKLCIDALRAQGIEKTHVHVLRDNPRGHDYWIARGWTERVDTQLYSFINGDNGNV